MINALAFKLGESDNEPVRRIADSNCFDGVQNWFESETSTAVTDVCLVLKTQSAGLIWIVTFH